MAEPVQIGILLYPNVTQLDATGPAQVLCRVPGARLHMIWKTRDPVPTDAGFSIVPTTTFADCPQLDVICVPGGGGQVALMGDPETLDFLRKQAAGARYVTSVCTGSLVLGAAGLLNGLTATTYWACYPELEATGAIPTAQRVVEHLDERIITAAGVSSGIDMALRLVELLVDRTAAQAAQLMIEYDPQPPFDNGALAKCDDEIVTRVIEYAQARQ
jgi:cyclohexyl-isocyanide hydratase